MPTDCGLRIIAAHMLALKQSAPAYDQRPKIAGAAQANRAIRIANISHLSKTASYETAT